MTECARLKKKKKTCTFEKMKQRSFAWPIGLNTMKCSFKKTALST